MDPAKIAAAGTEHAHQCAVMCWASQNTSKYPKLKWLYAVPNGGERNPAVAARLKAEGVKKGVSDLALPVRRKGYSGLFIEMKKPGKGGNMSKEQIEFGQFVTEEGFLFQCCDNWEFAVQVIEWYINEN